MAKQGEREYVVERILKKESRRGQMFYLLKWEGFSNRFNTWEPERNLNCDALIAEYEESRAIGIFGISVQNGRCVYIIKVKGLAEPVLVNRDEGRLWSRLIMRYWIDKIQFEGFTYEHPGGSLRVKPNEPIDENAVPRIIYITDMLGAELMFCLQFADGIIFETIENVERKWAHLAVEFFEQHLVID